jgi:3-keto-5-aminohexanoate cleavage enzyme
MLYWVIYITQSDLATVSSIYNHKPTNSYMCIGGIGKEQLKSNILGLFYFDGVRVGLEDNLYFKDKEKTTNIELLKRIHRLMFEMDINILNHKEFKELGYENKKINGIR